MKNADYILENRYVMRDSEGNPLEGGLDVFWRVADFLGETSREKEEYYTLMVNKDMLPNSPTLANAGVPDGGSLSACFVLSPDDNTDSIFETLLHAAHIVKSGGGVGFGFSKLRQFGDAIKTVHKKALGPINVMEIYSLALNKLTQGGSFREAALMGQLHISHPDIVEFIHCKDDRESLSNFNISVQITDDFMEAVEEDKEWHLISPRTGEVVKILSAKWLWNEIVTSAHLSGDPGCMFYDRVQETHPNDNLGPINGTNPCGEQALEDFGSCNLASINLGNFIVRVINEYVWDSDRLAKAVRSTVRMLNKVIDKNNFPLQELEDMNLLTRRIGLGVMGWADALARLGIQYDSEEGIREAEIVSSFIMENAWCESKKLADEYGPFPNYQNSKLARIGHPPYRNSCVMSIAPTGTISRVAECSFGIEPFFDLAWRSNILWSIGESTPVYDCPIVIRERIQEFFNGNEEDTEYFIKDLIDGYSSLDIILHKEEIDKLYRTSRNVSPEWHIRMQAAWQKNVSNSISKTINMLPDTTIDDVSRAYFLAWKENCKGITIYRSGTRSVEVLTTKENNDIIKVIEEYEQQHDNDVYKRPKTMVGVTEKVATGHGNFYVTMNCDNNGRLREVISNMGKSGACNNASLEVVSRIMSLALQYNVPEEELINQLSGITCCPNWDDGVLVLSPYDGLAKTMRKHKSNREKSMEDFVEDYFDFEESEHIAREFGKLCKKCYTNNIHEIGGCDTCLNCGDSKCG